MTSLSLSLTHTPSLTHTHTHLCISGHYCESEELWTIFLFLSNHIHWDSFCLQMKRQDVLTINGSSFQLSVILPVGCPESSKLSRFCVLLQMFVRVSADTFSCCLFVDFHFSRLDYSVLSSGRCSLHQPWRLSFLIPHLWSIDQSVYL